jgi:hypothetical protein
VFSFSDLALARNFRDRCDKPAFVFPKVDGSGYVVAVGRNARPLLRVGLEPIK